MGQAAIFYAAWKPDELTFVITLDIRQRTFTAVLDFHT